LDILTIQIKAAVDFISIGQVVIVALKANYSFKHTSPCANPLVNYYSK